MKEFRKIMVLMLLLSGFSFANGQLVLTETFVNRNFPAAPTYPAGNGSFTGLSGTVWNYTSIRTYTGYGQPNVGDTNYATFYSGGTLSATFTKKISQISFKANDDNKTDLATFEIYINNELKGSLSFIATETKTLTLSAPCKNNVVKIQFVSGRAMMDDLSITFDTLSPDTGCVEVSTRVYNIHSSFGNDPKTEMNISWSTPVADTGTYVLYGINSLLGSKSSSQFERVILHDTLDTILMMHHVTLMGLTPGTRYLYRCGGDAGLSGICSFRTAPAGNQSFTYAVISDVQEYASYNANFNYCAKFMKEQDVSFVIQLGDLVQQGSYLNQWNKFFESGRPIFEYAPFMAVIGSNHDVDPYSKYYCQDIFKFPSNKSSQYKNMWYSFEYSNAVYAGLHYSYQSIQKPWMDSVYKNTTKPWKFSYWHINPYSTGGHGGDGISGLLSTFLAVTDTYNIASVYNGHSHSYEFTHPILNVGNPPVLSKAAVNWNTRKATSDLSQGTVFYNGAGVSGAIAMNTYYAYGLPQEFTLTGDSVGGDKTILLATVYNDSIVYKVVFYVDCKTYKKGDVLFTYTILNDNPGTQYSLTVNSGSGDGNYNASTVVVITADAPATGKVFDKWTGDVANVANINSASTTITMPAANAAVTATYKDAPPYTYTLTVSAGMGSGNYTAGTVVNISANTPPSGKVFDAWTGNITGIADINDSATTITMPAANIGIAAFYKDKVNIPDGGSDGISVYPNPAALFINVNSGTPVSDIEISDLSGKILMNNKIENLLSLTVPVNNFGKGLFMIKIILTDGEIKYRLISIQ